MATAYDQLVEYRRGLRASDGILVRKELHAYKFVTGRGRPAPDRVIPKGRRAQIFNDTLKLATTLPDAREFNVVGPAGEDVRCFERLLTRINRTMQAWNTGRS